MPTVRGATLVAEVTDRPVWFLFGATVALAIVTAVLAGAAIKALQELGVAVQQLRVALQQLEEAKKDRHAAALSDLGRRWDDPAMSEALQLTARYSRKGLARVVKRAHRGPSRNPLRTRATRRADRNLVVALRVPNYFEDLALITEAGGLDPKVVSRNFVALARREWDFWGPAMAKMREDDEFAFYEFENLVLLLERLAEEAGQPAARR